MKQNSGSKYRLQQISITNYKALNHKELNIQSAEKYKTKLIFLEFRLEYTYDEKAFIMFAIFKKSNYVLIFVRR